MIKVLIFGDIYGRIGRNALIKNLPQLREKYAPDFVLANVDNLSSGRGAIEKHVLELEAVGIDAFSSGDHIFDNEERIKDYLNSTKNKIIFPANLYPQAKKDYIKKGYSILEKDGKKILFIHLIGQVFMHMESYNPFIRLKEILDENKEGVFESIIVDFHREATSEIAGMFHIYDGQISMLYGTHTHIQTNDDMISDHGTGFITDAGMTGPISSVIGAHPDSVRERFLSGIPKGKISQQTEGKAVISGLIAHFENGKCLFLEKFREIK